MSIEVGDVMVRIVHVSDTHGFHKQLKMPEADILIHTGDFCAGRGSFQQVSEFNMWLESLDYEHILLCPGNHDEPLESNESLCRSMLSCRVLINEEVTINGLKFWGSPYTPEFNQWHFNLPRGEKLKAVWDMMPDDTDVLLSHGPPQYILDLVEYNKFHAGCEDLARRVIEVSPLAHCFGHLHEEYGVLQLYQTYFINGSNCNIHYKPVNKPRVIEIDEVNKKVISIS